MREEVILNGNKKRYLLLDEVGVPVVPVMKLKYLDQTVEPAGVSRGHSTGVMGCRKPMRLRC